MPRKSSIDDEPIHKPLFPQHVELLHQSILRAPTLAQARVIMGALTKISPRKERLHARFLTDRTCARWTIDLICDLNAEVFLSHPDETLILSVSPEAMDEAISRKLVDPEQKFTKDATVQLRYGSHNTFVLEGEYTFLAAALSSHHFSGPATCKKILKIHDWNLEARTQGAAFFLLGGVKESVSEGIKLTMSGVDPFAEILATGKTGQAKYPHVVGAAICRGIAAVVDDPTFVNFAEYCWKGAKTPRHRALLLNWICQGATTTNAHSVSMRIANTFAHRARTQALKAEPLMAVVRLALQQGQDDRRNKPWDELLEKLGKAKIEEPLGAAAAIQLIHYVGAYVPPVDNEMFNRDGTVAQSSRYASIPSEKVRKTYKHVEHVLTSEFVKKAFDEEGNKMLVRFLETAKNINSNPANRTALMQELVLALTVSGRGNEAPKVRL